MVLQHRYFYLSCSNRFPMCDCITCLQIVDYFLLVFHTAVILFNLFAWISKPLRKAHLVVISLTFASWGILGIWYGWGYCPLTDWHWEVLYQLGQDDLPASFVSHLLERMLGWHLPDTTVDILTLGLALLALASSVKINFFSSSPAARKD